MIKKNREGINPPCPSSKVKATHTRVLTTRKGMRVRPMSESAPMTGALRNMSSMEMALVFP